MSKDKKGRGNYGIQARTVNAGAIAIGDGASITQSVDGGGDIGAVKDAISELRERLSRGDLPPEARAVLEEPVHAIAAEIDREHPDPDRLESLLKSLASKIKQTANVVRNAADLIEPTRKVALALGVAAAAIGLV